MEIMEQITKILQEAGALPKPRKKIEVVYIEQIDELGKNPFKKGHYTWKPF